MLGDRDEVLSALLSLHAVRYAPCAIHFMLISFNWLKQYIEIKESADTIAEMLTNSGLEVESVAPLNPKPPFNPPKGGTEEGGTLPPPLPSGGVKGWPVLPPLGGVRGGLVEGGSSGLLIGKVLTCKKHPNADRLKLTTVDIGKKTPSQIICGAPNVAAGQKVIVATPGTKLYPKNGEPFKIKEAKIRGEYSEGMICAEDEIGMGDTHDGIMVLKTGLAPGTPAFEYFSVKVGGDVIFEIGLTPNRADATSHFGVARELKALLRRKAALPSVDNFHSDNRNNCIDVIVEDHLACPRYAGVTISGITVKESPEWLQNRLNSVGLKPMNNVVDVTNFVLQECGQPLHAFDADEIVDKKVIVKTLPEGSRSKTLDGVERELYKADLMICNAKEPMCIAGVFGGEKSGVKQFTKDIFLESAYFSPETIRKTAQYHGLQTDASFRFERGTDPNMVIYALKRASVLIKELAGGTISSDIVDIYPEPLKNFEVKISYKNVERLIGKKLKEVEIKKILEYLDIKIIAEDVSGLKLSVPPYRVDVQREADIIEEILRIYGYDNIDINADLRTDYLADFPETDKEKIQNSIADLLSANGFNEIITNSLTNSVYTQKMRSRSLSAKDKSGGVGEDVFKFQDVKIINKLSDELGVLRQTMLFSGLEVIAHNVNRRQKDLKFYEFGKIYYKNNNKNTDDRVHVFKYSRVHGSSLEHKNTRTQEHILKGHTAAGSDFTQQAALQGYREENHLAIFMTGSKYSETWQQPNKNLDFHDIASYVYKILLSLNINNYEIKNINNNAIFDNGLICTANNKAIVKFGIVRHDLASLVPGIQLREHIYYADFDWDVIMNMPGRKIQVVSVPKYPEVRRDLSMILDNSVKFDDIKRIALKAEKKLLREVNVFDIYEGKSIDKSKKSYAISFILQDYNQTLTDKVIDKTMQRLMNVFETELNAVIRK